MRDVFRKIARGGGAPRALLSGVVAVTLAFAAAIGVATPASAATLDLAAPEHHKTIADNGDGTYRLSLDVKGGKSSESETVTQKTDIVLVMDTSGSMKYRMDSDWDAGWGQSRLDYAKAAANGLVDSVVKDGSDDVRVAVVSFNRDAQTTVGFTSDKESLKSGVNGLHADDGTNWEAGLAEANGLTARDGAKKYVVFLSDGEPTYRYETKKFGPWTWTEIAGSGSSYEQKNFDNAVTEAKKATNTTFFSVAVGTTRTVYDRMSDFQRQVAGSSDGCYSAKTPDELNRAFADITQQITRTAQYTNVTITDTLTPYVELADATDLEVTATDASGNKVALSSDDYVVSANGDTVTLAFRQGTDANTPGFVLVDGVIYTVSFNVKPTQAAYDAAAAAGQATELPTNAEGKLSYSVVNSNGTAQTVIQGADQQYDTQHIAVPVNTVSVQKVWDGGTVRPDTISVRLMRNGELYKTVALNKSGDYKADVVVPAGVGDFTWSVEEADVPAGYTPEYSDAVAGSGVLTVTNAYSVKPVTVDGKANLSGHKTLTGRDLKTGEFKFNLADASGKVIETVSNDAAGNFSFSDLTFDAAGAYTYTVSEDTSDLPAGVSAVTVGSKAVKIVVTDNGDGTLKADVQKDDLEFENAYQADATMFPELSFTKVLDGRDGGVRDGEFTFELKDKSGAVVATAKNDASGTVTFSPRIVFGQAGTYTYTVSEVNDGEKGVSYDTDARTVTVMVTDNGEGQLVAETSVDGGTTFTNTYEPASVDYSISQDVKVSKALTGRVLKDGEFTFELVENGEVRATATNDADGNVTFGELPYDKAGTYVYQVREAKGDRPGVTYDGSVHTVTVNVTDDGAGQLVAKASSDEGTITFTNRYDVKGANITFGATKELSGAKLADGQFAFQVKDGQGNVVATATNAADGSVVFSSLPLDAAGEYHFTMSEVNDGQANVTYDEAVHSLDVIVADDGEGHLYVSSYTVDGGTDLPAFSNAYTAPAAPNEPATPAATPNTGDASTSVAPIAFMACALLVAGVVVLRTRKNDR